MSSLLGHRPNFIATKVQLTAGDAKAILYADIDQKNIIQDLGFDLENWDEFLPLFDSYFQHCIGKNYSDAFSDAWALVSKDTDYFPYPALLLRQAMIEMSGGEANWAELQNEESCNLICRCFGVSKGQIEKMVLENPEANLLTITDETKAAGACSSCKEDVEQLINGLRTKYELDAPIELRDGAGHRIRLLGMNPAQLLLAIETEIKALDTPFSWELLRIDGLEVQIKIDSTNRIEHRENLELVLREKFPLKLSLLLL